MTAAVEISERHPIVVGVDGSEGAAAALRYAAREARRLDAGLRLVHVAPDLAPLVAMYPVAYRLPPVEAERAGRRLLSDAVKELGDDWPPGRVETSLVLGSAVDGLVNAARHAPLLVLGDQRRPVLDRLVTGSVLAAVAGRATVPVVAVPADWSPQAEHGRVVVGVKWCEDSEGLVRRAFEIARERAATLVLLHAWELPTLYDEVIASQVDEELWSAEARTQLQRLADSVRDDYPGVALELRVEHGQPARVLTDAIAEADLILLARRPHAFPWGHLGGTGRAVLREGTCPIEVLPPAVEPVGLEDLLLEEQGVMEKGKGSPTPGSDAATSASLDLG